MSSPRADDPVSVAGAASHNILFIRPRHGRQRRSNFILNPATGALEIAPDAGVVIEKALLRAARRLKFRLYLSFALLYAEKFRLQAASLSFQVKRRLRGFFRKGV